MINSLTKNFSSTLQFIYLLLYTHVLKVKCVCILSCFSCVWLFVTPWTPLSMGSSRQEYWSGLPCPPPGDLPQPGIEPASPGAPALHYPALSLLLYCRKESGFFTDFIYLLFTAPLWQRSAKLKCHPDGKHILMTSGGLQCNFPTRRKQAVGPSGKARLSCSAETLKMRALGGESREPGNKGLDVSSLHKASACSFHATFCSGHLHVLRFTRSLGTKLM